MAAATAPATHAPLAAAALDRAPEGELLLLVRLGDRQFAIPAGAIIRIIPMAAPTPLPATTPGCIGVLSFRGKTLPVIDPRPRLGLPAAAPHPDQYLVAIAAEREYFLWIDRAEMIFTAMPADRQPHGDTDITLSHLVSREGLLIPVFCVEAFAPASASQHAAPRWP